MKLTLAELKQAARKVGMAAKKEDGEYRVNFCNGSEATAYYTTDINDAYDTMLRMALGVKRS